MRLIPRSILLFLALISLIVGSAVAGVIPVPVPEEMRSTSFSVLVNGKPVDVAHAAAS